MCSVDHTAIFNAYKNGVVPPSIPENLCVGRQSETNEIKRCFLNASKGISNIKWLIGKYGSGKSFMLKHARDIALQDGFIVAHIQLDKAFRLNNLEVFYYYMMHNLFVKGIQDRKCSFDDLFDIWIENLQNTPIRAQAADEINTVITALSRYNNAFARSFLIYIRARIQKNKSISETISAWLTGEKNIPSHVKKQIGIIGSVDKFNMIDFMRAFSQLVILMGYKGFVVLVDELDLIVDERSDIRQSAYANMRQLIDLTGSSELKNTVFVMSCTPRLVTDKERGIHTYNALAQRMGQALDPNRHTLGDLKQPVIWLQPLSLKAFEAFTEAFVSLYKNQYDIDLKISMSSLKNWVFLSYHRLGIEIKSLTFRQYATKLLEILDIIEQNPSNNVFRTELIAMEKDGQLIFKSKAISG